MNSHGFKIFLNRFRILFVCVAKLFIQYIRASLSSENISHDVNVSNNNNSNKSGIRMAMDFWIPFFIVVHTCSEQQTLPFATLVFQLFSSDKFISTNDGSIYLMCFFFVEVFFSSLFASMWVCVYVSVSASFILEWEKYTIHRSILFFSIKIQVPFERNWDGINEWILIWNRGKFRSLISFLHFHFYSKNTQYTVHTRFQWQSNCVGFLEESNQYSNTVV